MRTHFPVIAIAAIGAGGLLFACTVNSTTNNNNVPAKNDASLPPGDDSSTPTPDGGTTPVGEDAAVDSGDSATATPQAFVRIADWSPDAMPVDVCFNDVGGDWASQMPQLAQIAAASDAGTLGDGGGVSIAFPQVTSYLLISPGTYAVRLVAASATNCATPVVDLPTVTLAANSYTTIAALGEATRVGSDQPLSLVPFTDDVSAPAGQIALRFINASPGQSLSPADLGTGSLAGSGGPFAALFTAVAFGKTGAGSDAGTVDANGYLAITPLATATLSAHITAYSMDATVALNDVTMTATSAATVALVNGVSNGLSTSGAKLLQCADVDDSAGTSLLSTCSIISTQ
jgi:hypothetical protein